MKDGVICLGNIEGMNCSGDLWRIFEILFLRYYVGWKLKLVNFGVWLFFRIIRSICRMGRARDLYVTFWVLGKVGVINNF